ncbi:MAG: 50S ribosomal protein L25 [Thermorudis peleae]|nr:50S ribosomal protein L25 [Thermorudis peleae]
MAEHPTLQATVRTVVGKKVKRLRRQGKTPAVLYGPVVAQPLPITVDARAFAQVYHRAGTTSLVDILLDGQVYSVFIREVAVHPVSREVQNVEFYAPDLQRPVVVTVPVVGVGALPPDVVGVVAYPRAELEVRALPQNVPTQIEVDLSVLNPDRLVIHAGEIPLPAGVELVTDPDEVVVVVEEETVEEAEVPGEEALAEELGDRPAASRAEEEEE